MTVNVLSEVVLRLYVSEVNVKRYSAPRSPTSLRLSNLTAPDTISPTAPRRFVSDGVTLTAIDVSTCVQTFPTESTKTISGAGISAKSFSFTKGGAVNILRAAGAPGITVNCNKSVSSVG